jgi:hypothetical protein
VPDDPHDPAIHQVPLIANIDTVFGTVEHVTQALSLVGAFIVDCDACVSIRPLVNDIDFIMTLMRIKSFYTDGVVWPAVGSDDEDDVRFELGHGTLLDTAGYGGVITPELAANPEAQRALIVFNTCRHLAGWCVAAWPDHQWK